MSANFSLRPHLIFPFSRVLSREKVPEGRMRAGARQRDGLASGTTAPLRVAALVWANCATLGLYGQIVLRSALFRKGRRVSGPAWLCGTGRAWCRIDKRPEALWAADE